MGKEKIDFKIERARKEDLDKLASLYLESYVGLEEYSYTHRDDVEAYLKWLWNRDSEGIFVARADGEIVGFVAGDSNWFSKRSQRHVGAVHELAVLPSYRGLGIGKALMERVMEYFEGKGLDRVELWVGDENYRAIEFYSGLGFRKDGQYNYWVRMVKDLSPRSKG